MCNWKTEIDIYFEIPVDKHDWLIDKIPVILHCGYKWFIVEVAHPAKKNSGRAADGFREKIVFSRWDPKRELFVDIVIRV